MNDDKFWDQDAPYNQDTDGDRRAETSPSPYSHYQFHQSTAVSERERPVKRRKKTGFIHKLPGTIALAAVFGLVAGIVFQCVDNLSGGFLEAYASARPRMIQFTTIRGM